MFGVRGKGGKMESLPLEWGVRRQEGEKTLGLEISMVSCSCCWPLMHMALQVDSDWDPIAIIEGLSLIRLKVS